MECSRFGSPSLTRECRECARRLECFEHQTMIKSVFLLPEARPAPEKKLKAQARMIDEDPPTEKK
jgi:hypothetical protein